MATRKALGSTITNPRSKQTAAARGRHQTGGSATRSKHTAKAVSNPYGTTRKPGSTGGGTSAMTSGLLGKATRRYEKRNNTRRPNSK